MKRLVILAIVVLSQAAGVFAGGPSPILNPANGHYYYLSTILPPAITWQEAKNRASAGSFTDKVGHLLTISDQAELDFVTAHLGWSPNAWLGGYQPDGSAEPDGGWQWVTVEPWAFTNWAAGQPDNTGGIENRLAAGA